MCSLLLLALLSGCGKPASKKETKNPKPEKNPFEGPFYTNSGSITTTSKDGKTLAWDVRWERSKTELNDKGTTVVRMQGVSGNFYEKGKPVSHFISDHGVAVEEKGTLSLDGNVKLTGIRPAGEMNCDQLEWNRQKEMVRAIGNVRVKVRGMRLPVFPEIWAKSNLHEVATPDMYSKL